MELKDINIRSLVAEEFKLSSEINHNISELNMICDLIAFGDEKDKEDEKLNEELSNKFDKMYKQTEELIDKKNDISNKIDLCEATLKLSIDKSIENK